MTIACLEREFPTDHLPLLRWLMFTGVSAFGFVLAWHYGLFHLMLASDKTYISVHHHGPLRGDLAALPRRAPPRSRASSTAPSACSRW